MADPQITALARRLRSLEKARLASKQPRLDHSSIEDGAIVAVDADGNQVMQIGKQYDGTHVAAPLTGPIPPTPAEPIVEPIIGGLKVRVTGGFADQSIVVPMDFSRWEIHVSQDPEFIPDPLTTLYATIESPRGGEHALALPYTPHYVRIVARTLPGKGSAPSPMSGPHQPRFVAQLDLDPEIDLGGGGTDGLAPTESPTAAVSPLGIGALLASWTPVVNDDPVTYSVYVSLNPIEEASPSILLTTTSAPQVAISSLPGGGPIPPGSRVYVRVMARDADGPAPALGAEGSAIPRRATTADVAADFVYAGMVDATQIQTGSLEAILAVLGGLTVGDLAQRHIKINPDVGFELVNQAGESIVHFPISTDGVNKFVGDLVAQGFTAMGRTQFRGQDNEISMNSVFTMASGVTAPANVPTIDVSYREPVGIPAKSTVNYLTTWQGQDQKFSITPQGTYATVTDKGGTGVWAGKKLRIQEVNPADGTLTDTHLTFVTQEGYNAPDAQELYAGNGTGETVVTGTTAERANMTISGNSLYDGDPYPVWDLITNGFKGPQSEAYGVTYREYVTLGTGTKTVTMTYGKLAADNNGVDARPIMSKVGLWFYNGDTRKFNNKVEISPDGVTWTTIFDTAVSGTYAESINGKFHTFAEQKVHKVRVTMSGSTVNATNHITEIDAYGVWPSVSAVAGSNHSRPIRIGSHWYVLYDVMISTGMMSSESRRRIGKFDLTGQQVAVWDYLPYSYEDPTASGGWFSTGGQQYPSITTDGTDLIIGQIRPTDGHIRFQHFAIAGATSTLPAPYKEVFTNIPHTEAGNYSLSGLLYGSFDLGAPHYFALSGTTMRAYTATGQRINENDFDIGGSGYSGEAAWDGTRFICGAGLYSSGGLTKTSTSKSTAQVRAAFTWYDSDPGGTGTHETTIGPVTVATRRPRYGVTISTGVAIPDAGDADSPDSHRLYAFEGVYTGPSDLKLLPGITETSIYGSRITTQKFADGAVTGSSAPPVANSFPNGFAAEFRSAVGGFVVKGDGTGAWPSLENKIKTSYDAAIAAAVADLAASMWSPGDLKISARPGETMPGSWLECKGQRLVQNDYLDLYNAIGFTYGPNLGDGTFPLPDPRKRGFKGAATDLLPGVTGGASTATLTEANLPPHGHDMTHDHSMTHDHANATVAMRAAAGGSSAPVRGNSTADGSASVNIPQYTGNTGASSKSTTGNGNGTSTPINIEDPYISVRVWIKV